MRDRSRQLYILSWMAYVIFSMFAFPYLSITVMLFSIPLTMVGGWLYRYKGALTTTVLTIPYHYLMLNLHSDTPSIIIEAFNPFGIGSLLLFSLAAAVLQSLRQRYRKLNYELENIVAERTKNLRQLVDHFLEMQHIDRSIISSGLFEMPDKLLERILELSELLYANLKDQNHPEASNAQLIRRHILQCRDQLSGFMIQSQPEIESNATLMENIQKLSDRMMQLGGGKLNINMNGKWEVQDRERCHQIYNIISEAIANAIRHANASQINIDCKCGHAGMTITIENNGDAFPSHLHEGMGLPMMRHRATSIGGTFTIEGGTGQQTRVICTIPQTATADEKAFPKHGQRLNTTA